MHACVVCIHGDIMHVSFMYLVFPYIINDMSSFFFVAKGRSVDNLGALYVDDDDHNARD